jgi:hypothetical protein
VIYPTGVAVVPSTISSKGALLDRNVDLGKPI